jgi:hypothetical protein
MAGKVHITKRGIQALKWDRDVRQYVEQKIRSGVHLLRCACYIDAGVTLGDIFRTVEQDPELLSFLEQWSWCDVEAFHSEARKPAIKAFELSCIEVSKHFEWDKPEAQETIDVSGIGEPDEHGMTYYGLDFTPVNQLVHLPVRLRPEMEIRNERKSWARRHVHLPFSTSWARSIGRSVSTAVQRIAIGKMPNYRRACARSTKAGRR